MLINILIIVGVIVVLFLIVVALQPSDFRIARSTSISAPPAAIFPQVNSLHKFQEWSPWAKLDPDAKNTFEGPGEGTGAAFRWAGNAKVGAGSMTITASKPVESVTYRLDFLKPFPGTNIAEFTFKPDGNQTLVTWSMTGKKSFVPKIFCTFMNMDKMVGGHFEEGLANLKRLSESTAGG